MVTAAGPREHCIQWYLDVLTWEWLERTCTGIVGVSAVASAADVSENDAGSAVGAV